MPTYEFRCPNGHDFEHFYKTMSTAPSEAKCPECGALAVRQLSCGGALVFKGSGFYLTDYGKNAHRKPAPETKAGANAEGSGGASESNGESKGESKSESKGESKSESKGESKSESTKSSESAS